MEPTIKVLIYIHAGAGGIALVAGLVAMIAKKGLRLHRKSGLLFYYSMLVSAVIAMVVSVLPNHESPFLFAVGIFSLYFVLTGKRALLFKRKNHNLATDKWISGTMIFTGILMISLPPVLTQSINIVLTAFALLGIFFSVQDFMLYRNPKKLKKSWLRLHLVKMLSGYISATTAFVVVNHLIPGIYGWLAPGVVGGLLIAYWSRMIDRKKMAQTSR